MSARPFVAALLVAAFLASSVPTSAVAQGHDMATMDMVNNTVTFTDPPQDVVFYAGTRSPVTPQNATTTFGTQFDHLDILKVVVGEETERDFKVSLFLKALNPSSQAPLGFPFRTVTFSYGRIDWRIAVGGCQGMGNQNGQQSATQGCLGFRDGGSNGARDYRNYKSIPMQASTSDNAFVFTIDKSIIFNENRVPARFGDTLTNLSATAMQFVFQLPFFPGNNDPVGGIEALDRAPNNGFADKTFQFIRGSNGKGHLGLSSKTPIRVSNGEATTIVYKVDVFNHATEAMTAQLEVSNLRDGWSARVPSIVKVPASSNLTFPVILALPFTHEHGRTATFTVTAKDVGDSGSEASLDLGVFWTDIPQPSAHHNGQMWFHSAPFTGGFNAIPNVFASGSGWMNSIETDPDPDATDDNVPSGPNEGFNCVFPQGGGGGPAQCGAPPASKVSWFFPLSPGLLIGLDFDLAKQGRVLADFQSQLPASNAKLTAKLLYCDPTASNGAGGRGLSQNQTCFNYNVLLAQGTVANTIAANSPVHFEVPLEILPAADLIPYRPGANIGLRLELVTDTPLTFTGGQPRPELITKKGNVFLPLIEYHDPVEAAFQNVGALQLTPLSGFEKKVNPGRNAVFEFNITNQGKADQRLKVDLQGVNAEWAQLVSEDHFVLGPGATHTIRVNVHAPEDAQQDERAELFLAAHSVDDETVVTVARIRATVTQGEDIPDEAYALESHKGKSPGFEFVPLVAIALLVVAARRRSP